MSDDLKKPWDPDYVAPEPDKFASQRAGAKAHLASVKRKEARKAADPNYDPNKPDPTSGRSKKLKRMDADNLSDKKKQFYNDFIQEYIKDFSAPKAWVRAGGKLNSSTRSSYEALKTQYCQLRMQALIDMLEEEQLVTDKEIVLGIKKEALSFGDGTSQTGRVAAWKLLAQLKGKLIKKTESNVNHAGGVMLIPVPANTEQWEQMAQSSQEQLKHDVRT